ncbi:MAG: hypothetical protein ACREQV_12415 [Candidatus Binatia bacterium]
MNHEVEPEIRDAEFSWIACQEKACKMFIAGRQQGACTEWRSGAELAEQFDANDPRRAASLNNLGIGLRIEDNDDESERLYRDSEQAWKNAALWIEEMRLQPRARSSLFHLRLESNHARIYNARIRGAYQQLLSAGYAVTLNNMGELFGHLGYTSQARDLYGQAYDLRCTAMDENETLARRMKAHLNILNGQSEPSQSPTQPSAFAYTELAFNTQAEKMKWIVDRPPEFTDEGRLMAAVLGTQMLVRIRELRQD